MIRHPGEEKSDAVRARIAHGEPRSSRTFTPTQLVIARSEGVFHWTPEGRRLYDFASGVLVANLGHNSPEWKRKFEHHAEGLPLTAYNAITTAEDEAVTRLLALLRSRPGGGRLEQVLWAASGSEAIQKALWSALKFRPDRDLIVATRDGFHGKKGLAGATTGRETDPDRDPRVRFLSFPVEECRDVSLRDAPFDPAPYEAELAGFEAAKVACLITEPYLGGGGSYHPPAAYLRLLQDWCRRHDVIFILDEIQSNFGRTGKLFAFESYGLEPDVVVLGKGLGNGVPAAAAVGRADLLASLDYGEGSDTYSAHPLCCAAVLATLDVFEPGEVLKNVERVSPVIEQGLIRLKEIPFVKHVRGEKGGMVWGVEIESAERANACVEAAYRGGVHLLGPLAKTVLRISPPLVIAEDEARDALDALHRALSGLVE